ncbi:hypothetical protein M885DRAFT_556881 [Pelagophyceae sp. CCMP2097]|nr:hypothetical protein M885DRAFT_556881 [Pelagophyceae sp. CCMP2097]
MVWCVPECIDRRLRVTAFEVPPGVAQERWEGITNDGVCCYRNAAEGCPCFTKCPCLKAGGSRGAAYETSCTCCDNYFRECTWRAPACPAFFPQAVQAPFIGFGQTITLLTGEPVLCCELGKQGIGGCLCLLPPVLILGFPPFVPLQFSHSKRRPGIARAVGARTALRRVAAACMLSLQREYIVEAYKIEDMNVWRVSNCFCYPCNAWRNVLFLKEMALVGQAAEGGLALVETKLKPETVVPVEVAVSTAPEAEIIEPVGEPSL